MPHSHSISVPSHMTGTARAMRPVCGHTGRADEGRDFFLQPTVTDVSEATLCGEREKYTAYAVHSP